MAEDKPEFSEQQKSEQTEQALKVLPPELQRAARSFFNRVALALVSQQTRISGEEGEQGSVDVTPDQVEFYKSRFDEIIDSNLLNPHLLPPAKIEK